MNLYRYLTFASVLYLMLILLKIYIMEIKNAAETAIVLQVHLEYPVQGQLEPVLINKLTAQLS